MGVSKARIEYGGKTLRFDADPAPISVGKRSHCPGPLHDSLSPTFRRPFGDLGIPTRPPVM